MHNFKVSVFDSVVQGGDAVWEGLRVYNKKILKLEDHLDRFVEIILIMFLIGLLLGVLSTCYPFPNILNN